MSSRTALHRMAAPFGLLLAAAWMLRNWNQRWIPHDEGTLAGSAVRVLAGQLPHRDYDEVYSGGLAYLHAALFALFGERLAVLRWLLIAPALLLFAPCLYALARRFVAPWPAAAAAAAAFAWGVPNYPAALPSWFNLMLAAGALGALLRGETSQYPSRWFLLAGGLVGASLAIKVAGLYALAASLVWLALLEQRQARESDSESCSVLLPIHAAICAGLAFALLQLVGKRLGAAEFLHFVLPPVAATGLLVLGERRARGRSAERLRRLCCLVLPFVLGVALGCAPLVLTFAKAGALGDLYRGLFVLPASRLERAAWSPPALKQIAWALPLALLLAFAPRIPRPLGAICLLALGCALPFGAEAAVYQGAWAALRPLPALLVLAGVWRLRGEDSSPVAQALVLGVAFCGLVRFPFSTPLYFPYIAPLLVLLAVWLGRPFGSMGAWPGLALALLFPILWLHTGTLSDFGWGFHRQSQLRALDPVVEGRRAGLQVHASEVQLYGDVLAALREHAPPGPLLAGPDTPELPFLAGRPDPTRGPFAFFASPGGAAPLDERLRQLREDPPAAVVVNTRPSFSKPDPPAFLQALNASYGQWFQIGPFLVGVPSR